MSYKNWNEFIVLLERHEIDIKSQKAFYLFNEYKKVIV